MCTIKRAVGDDDIGKTHILKGNNNGAAGASCPQKDGKTIVLLDVCLLKVLCKTEGIRVVAEKEPVFINKDKIDGTNPCGIGG